MLMLPMTSLIATAQYAVPRPPLSGQMHSLRALQPKGSAETVQLDTLVLTPPSKVVLDSLRRIPTDGLRIMPFAWGIEQPLPTEHLGQWLTDGSGRSLWRLVIHSPGAYSLGLRLEGYNLPEGAGLYIHTEQGEVRGAFTSINNSSDGILELAPVVGERLTIEYNPPKGEVANGRVPFRIARVNHGYRALPHLRAYSREDDGAIEGEPFYDYKRRTLERYTCAPNILAVSRVRDNARSVLLMITGGEVLSSAALINNVREDGTAYVLTSAHCLNRAFTRPELEFAKESARTAVFFFAYDSPATDGNIRPTHELTLSGAELLVYDVHSDAALLRITGLPVDASGRGYIPSQYNPYFSGWNISATPPAPYHGIHHPYAMPKRYSEAPGPISIRDYFLVDDYPWEDKHWFVSEWTVGTTAVASSGSPLFDSEGRILGGLTGGRSTCSYPEQDYYWALRQVWGGPSDTRLGVWLDPDGTGVTSLEGYDPIKSSPLYRLSTSYARGGLAQMRADEGLSTTEGVGRTIVLQDGVRPLGAFVVFKGNEALQNAFPKLRVELRRLTDNVLGDVVWSEPLNAAHFHRYNASSGHFEDAIRTIAYDSIEIFVPASESPELSAGTYMLGLRSDEGVGMGLPLLYREVTDGKALPLSMYWRYGQGLWSATDIRREYWLDLLLEGQRTADDSFVPRSGQPLRAWVHGGRLYLESAESGETQITLYALDGKRVYQTRQTLGRTETSLPLALPSATYIIQLKSPTSELVLKVQL